MYRVTIINDGVETIIHSPHVNELKLAEGIIKAEINAIDSFSLGMYMNNPGYGKMRPFKTFVKVLNTKTGKYEFEGRVLGPSESMENSGLVMASYECEGELGYLHDSQQRHLEFRGTPLELFTGILDYHNSQVEDYKKFYVGSVTVTDPNDYIYLYLSAELDTFGTIKEKLIDRLGGELQIRKENGVRYLDYLVKIGEDKSTEIRLAKNLISMSRDIDPTEIITRLTPLGTRIESEDEEATDASEARLTIENVNNGLPYIDRQDLIDVFGIQGGAITWDDITEPGNLLSRGVEYLNNQKVTLNQYTVTAADLSLIGLDIDSFETGNSYPVKNPIMKIDERLRIVSKSININSPQDASITIGDKFKNLYEYQSDVRNSAKQVVELQSLVSRQSQAIGTLRTELQSVDTAVDNIQQIIDEGDIGALEQAVNDLEAAIDNLNTVIGDIPIYEPATPLKDGLMSRIDKLKLDTLQNYGLVTPISDGLMAGDDKVKLDLISVIDSIDLDELKDKIDLIIVTEPIDLDGLASRVEILEGEMDVED